MLNARASKSLFLALVLLLSSIALAQSNAVTAIKCGRLINPTDGSVTQNAIIILFVSTYALTITGGHMNNAGLNPDIPTPEPATLTDSRDAMIAEIRREVKYGAITRTPTL